MSLFFYRRRQTLDADECCSVILVNVSVHWWDVNTVMQFEPLAPALIKLKAEHLRAMAGLVQEKVSGSLIIGKRTRPAVNSLSLNHCTEVKIKDAYRWQQLSNFSESEQLNSVGV